MIAIPSADRHCRTRASRSDMAPNSPIGSQGPNDTTKESGKKPKTVTNQMLLEAIKGQNAKLASIDSKIDNHGERITTDEDNIYALSKRSAVMKTSMAVISREQLALKRETVDIRKWITLKEEEDLKNHQEDEQEKRIVIYNDLQVSILAPYKNAAGKYDYKTFALAQIRKHLKNFEEEDLVFTKRLPHQDSKKFRFSMELSTESFAGQLVRRASNAGVNCRKGERKKVRDLMNRQWEQAKMWNSELKDTDDYKFVVKGAKIFRVNRESGDIIAECVADEAEDHRVSKMALNLPIYDRFGDDQGAGIEPESEDEDEIRLIRLENVDKAEIDKQRDERKRKRTAEERENAEFFSSRSPQSKRGKTDVLLGAKTVSVTSTKLKKNATRGKQHQRSYLKEKMAPSKMASLKERLAKVKQAAAENRKKQAEAEFDMDLGDDDDVEEIEVPPKKPTRNIYDMNPADIRKFLEDQVASGIGNKTSVSLSNSSIGQFGSTTSSSTSLPAASSSGSQDTMGPPSTSINAPNEGVGSA